MTDFKMTDHIFCKMTNLTLKMTNLLKTLNLTSRWHLTFHVAFNKTLRASKVIGANPGWGPFQADRKF